MTYTSQQIQAMFSCRSTAYIRKRPSARAAGFSARCRKMSTNQTSSTYQAVDKLRPAEAFTLAFPGTPSRLNLFLQTLVLFNSDVATDSDNFWTDGPTVDVHVSQGFVYDYYFKRFGRHGMDDREIEVDTIVHPLSRSEANRQPPDIVNMYINNAFYCCDGLMVFGDGDGRTWNFLPAASTSSRMSGRTGSPTIPRS